MALGIRYKLAIAFAATSLLVTVTVFAAMLFSFRAGFLQYVNDLQLASLRQLSELVAKEVSTQDGWRALANDKRRWNELVRELNKDSQNPLLHVSPQRLPRQRHSERGSPEGRRHEVSPPPRRDRRPPPPQTPFVLLDSEKRFIHGKQRVLKNMVLQAVMLDETHIGYVGSKRLKDFSSNADKVFVAKQTQFFIWIALIASGLAIVVAFVLAKYMVVPIQLLGDAMTALTRRDYKTRVDYQSKDELGGLVQSFNQLAKTLGDYETSQQQWIADISHELRTPLATLRGEVEALQDGVREMSPVRVNSLGEEVLRLQGLVDDLHQLAMSDLGAMRYSFGPVMLLELLRDLFDRYKDALQKNELEIDFKVLGDEHAVYGDDDRLYQLFRNLMQNSLRYSDRNGRVRVTINFSLDKTVQLLWEDSPPGVSFDVMERLFDRLYRAEQSRDRSKGGSGLGLSICKSIVLAHNGEISAEQSPLGGLAIQVQLPLVKSKV